MISVKKLSKKYNNVTAVDDISFIVNEGDILGLLGPNGAGKSTTINIISGILSQSSGEIEIMGKEFKGRYMEKIKTKMGFVPQDIVIFEDLTARENLEYFGRLYGVKGKLLKERVDETLEFIGLSNVAKKFPKIFSGGMKRRLNIGCALVHQPELIILDEPTVGIDAQSRNHILEVIKKLNKNGATIIYTSHYMEEIENLCNEIIIIDKGKIVEQGKKTELIKKYNSEEIFKITLDKKINKTLVKEIKEVIDSDKIQANEKTLEAKINTEKGELTKVIAQIEKNKYSFISIDKQNNNLEDIFLMLTGKSLRD